MWGKCFYNLKTYNLYRHMIWIIEYYRVHMIWISLFSILSFFTNIPLQEGYPRRAVNIQNTSSNLVPHESILSDRYVKRVSNSMVYTVNSRCPHVIKIFQLYVVCMHFTFNLLITSYVLLYGVLSRKIHCPPPHSSDLFFFWISIHFPIQITH